MPNKEKLELGKEKLDIKLLKKKLLEFRQWIFPFQDLPSSDKFDNSCSRVSHISPHLHLYQVWAILWETKAINLGVPCVWSEYKTNRGYAEEDYKEEKVKSWTENDVHGFCKCSKSFVC